MKFTMNKHIVYSQKLKTIIIRNGRKQINITLQEVQRTLDHIGANAHIGSMYYTGMTILPMLNHSVPTISRYRMEHRTLNHFDVFLWLLAAHYTTTS